MSNAKKCKILLSFSLIIAIIYMVMSLTSCDIISSFIPGLGGPEDECEHAWGDGVIAKVATCGTDEEGVVKYTCSKCGEIREQTVAAKPEHELDKVAKREPTCDKEGVLTEKCKTCEYEKSSSIDPLGHSWDIVDIVEVPTCGTDEEGFVTYTCSKCGDSFDEVIYAADAHEIEVEILQVATCILDGLTIEKCSKCGYTNETAVDALGHSYGDPEQIGRPTCGTDETATLRTTCTLCGEYTEKTVPAQPEHKLETTVVTEATCGVSGLTKETCEYCDYLREIVTEALVHDYALTEVAGEEGRYAYVCIYCKDIEKYINAVRYEDFGAVGDGETDDSAAIRAAHEYANKNGLAVIGNPNATYYIGAVTETIPIKTNTDWNGATLIFDDSVIPWDDANLRSVWVFTLQPEFYSYNISYPTNMTLKKGQTNIGMTFDAPCMIRIQNADERIYIRYGANANNGSYLGEFILVDENGNVDPSTPIQYDYEKITSIKKYSIQDEPIFVGNGTIITKVPNPKEQDPDYENNYCFYNRGIKINRSNSTVYGIDHYVEGEQMTVKIDRNGDGFIDQWGADKSYGVPYNGFYTFQDAYNVTLDKCIVQGHQAYNFYMSDGATRNEMGSYEIYANNCIELNLTNITQREHYGAYPDETVITNRFMYHGIMGSNFCRNIVMDNCYLDRFDSHQAMHNARITNSTLGFGILVIGGGELYIENVHRISEGAFILLRTDYNSVFDGDVVIKNCSMGINVTKIITGLWRKFDSGLPNWITRSLTIDGLTVESGEVWLYDIAGASVEALNDNVNKLYIPLYATVSGVRHTNGSSVTVHASTYKDALATVEINPDLNDIWVKFHTWDDGVVLIAPSSTDCTPGIIRYTCKECGITGDRYIISDVPHASLEATVTDGVVTYNCPVCDHVFTPEKSYYMDGSDHSAISGINNSTNFTTVANNNQNPLINADGQYELLKKNSRAEAKFQLWIPSSSPDIVDLNAENNAFAVLSFKVNAYTDNYIRVQLVDTNSNIYDDRWTANGCIVDSIFTIAKPDANGVVKVTGWDNIVLKSATVGEDKFTGWLDVMMLVELSSEDDTVTVHYYIDGERIGSASRELTTLTNSINSVYIEGKTKAKESGIMLDDILFGYTYRKCSPSEE